MAKKTSTSKKKTTGSKKSSSKSSSTKSGAGGSKKKTTKKSASSKKVTTKKTTKKATTKKAASKKPAAKKSASKKTETKKAASKSKKTTSKASTKKLSKADQEAAEMAAAKKAAEKKIADAKAADAKKNSGRKGITIVDDKPKRRSGSGKTTKVYGPPPGAGLLSTKRKPLIASGPKAGPATQSLEESDNGTSRKKPKTPFNKRELEKFKTILLTKRAELVGDVATMERGVLSLGDKGGDPATDVAEQGSDAYDQSLSIGLAEVDRKLIREIDDAVERIEKKTYGLCEMTGKPIAVKRLEELPWTRHSIEAARELERRGTSA